jgi:hypothetical protein
MTKLQLLETARALALKKTYQDLAGNLDLALLGD